MKVGLFINTQFPEDFNLTAYGVAAVILAWSHLLSIGCIRSGLYWLGSWLIQWTRQKRPCTYSAI